METPQVTVVTTPGSQGDPVATEALSTAQEAAQAAEAAEEQAQEATEAAEAAEQAAQGAEAAAEAAAEATEDLAAVLAANTAVLAEVRDLLQTSLAGTSGESAGLTTEEESSALLVEDLPEEQPEAESSESGEAAESQPGRERHPFLRMLLGG